MSLSADASTVLRAPGRLAHSTAVRLAGLVRADGSFKYRYDAVSEVEMSGYNALRHAGCIWAMNEAAARLGASHEFRIPIKRALCWFIERYVKRVTREISCVVEKEKIKLGGNALAALAILSTVKNPEFGTERWIVEPSDLIQPLCQYMMLQITSDGDFIHKRDFASGEIEPFRSAYYTGEALFALLEVTQWKPDTGRQRLLFDLLHCLVGRGYGIVEQSHWMMYAIEAAYRLDPDAALLRYADRVAENILDNPTYRERQNSTPIACRSEALLCYLRVLKGAARAEEPIFFRALKELSRNVALQLKDYLPDGAFRKGATDPTVRIDYLQHNLTSLLGFHEFHELAVHA